PLSLIGFRVPTMQEDVWSAACVLAELFGSQPLFRADGSHYAIASILQFTGHPGRPVFPRARNFKVDIFQCPMDHKPYTATGPQTLSTIHSSASTLLLSMLRLKPNRRPHLATVLASDFFQEDPVPVRRAKSLHPRS
ncbi:hypothetical protein V8E36_006658, partial [Tilletia maclaganii]